MSAHFPVVLPHRNRGWRRILEDRAWVRNPVSITRQRFSIFLLFVLSVLIVLYHYNTRDEAIRRRAIAFLTEATAGEVRVQRAHFQMFGGITLDDVRISAPYHSKLDPTAVDLDAREIFSARAVTLLHSPWRLLFGKLSVEHAIAAEPRITLIHNVDTDVRNWQLLVDAERPNRTSKGPSVRPLITLRAAKAVAVSVHDDGNRETRTEELDADIRPHPQIDTGYCIEVRRYSDPPERTTVVLDPGAQLLTNTPFVDAQTVRLQLPKVARQFFDQIALEGEVKLGRLMYAENKSDYMDTDIELRRVRCRVPLAMLRSGRDVPPTKLGEIQDNVDMENSVDAARGEPAEEDGVIQLTDAVGKLSLRGGKLEMDVSGLFNGARCTVRGFLDDPGLTLAQMGIDVRVTGQRIPTPEGSVRHRIMTDPAVPEAVKAFFVDYDPHGEFDIDIRIVRPRGTDRRVELHGSFSPVAAQGSCRWFPYEVTHLSGLIRVEGPYIQIENLVGQHGPATLRINAKLDCRREWADARVDVVANHVPLDANLFQALSEQDRALWKRFNPGGVADISVQLLRPPGDDPAHEPSWTSRVTADLNDAKLVFAEYPYPLDRVGGRLVIEDQRMKFIELAGHRDDAVVRVDGEADFSDERAPTVRLRLDAKNVPLDRVLADALQPEGRGAFEQFQPAGRIDLAGTISLTRPEQGIVYNLKATVTDATICYQQFPFKISRVRGEILLHPEGFSVMHVSGRHEGAVISASGDIRRYPDGYVADLLFDCGHLVLDDVLYQALPPRLREIWQLLKPRGVVNIQTALHQVARESESLQRHRTRVRTEKLQACFAGFPLPLTDVRADVDVNDRKVEIRGLNGKHGDSDISLVGEFDLDRPEQRGTLAVDAKRLMVSPDLLSALPAGLREAMASIKAQGRFDLRLDTLHFGVDPGGRPRWAFSGVMDVDNATVMLGFPISGSHGRIEGHGNYTESAGFSLDARLRLKEARLSTWQLEQLECGIRKDPDSNRVEINNVAAHAYGGQATGDALVRLRPNSTEYHVSIFARDMQLSSYLASLAKPPDPVTDDHSHDAEDVSGTLDGNLILHGQNGTQAFREGTGLVRVKRAQVWRLPIIFLIFQVLNLTPDENVFHDGRLEFFLKDDLLTFQSIDLQGKALSFVGEGTMLLGDNTLDVLLLARSPVRIRIPLLTDIAEAFARELMEVRLTGTLDHPTIRPQPLRSLGLVLKLLFAPPPARGSE